MAYAQNALGLIRFWLARKLHALRVGGASLYTEVKDLSLINLICSRCLRVAGRLYKVFSSRYSTQCFDWFFSFGNFTVAVLKAQFLDMCLARWESCLRVSIFMYYL